MKRVIEFLILCLLTALWAAFIFLWLFGGRAIAQTTTIRKVEFTSVYDLNLLCPQQVMWTLRAHDLGDTTREPSWTCMNDINDGRARVRHHDFTHSGFDRGHLCPAQDRSRSLASMRPTFALSNVAAQAPALNRGEWKKTEVFCRHQALLFDSIEVVVVPLFLNRDTLRIGSHHVAVPHAFFKAAWVHGTDSVLGCWFFFNH